MLKKFFDEISLPAKKIPFSHKINALNACFYILAILLIKIFFKDRLDDTVMAYYIIGVVAMAISTSVDVNHLRNENDKALLL